MYENNRPTYTPPYPQQTGYQQPYSQQNFAPPPPMYPQPQPMYAPLYPQQYYQPLPQYIPAPIPLQENGIPITPLPNEKKWINKFYNWTGGFMLIHFGIANVVVTIVMVIAFVIMGMTQGSDIFRSFGTDIYKNQNFCFIAILSTMLAYLTANLIVFFVGCKTTKIKPKPLFKFSGFSAKLVLFSIAIGLFVQTIISVAVELLNNVADLSRFESSFFSISDKSSAGTLIVYCLYACIIAPITEELVFRCFVLKNLSRFNLRFGIIASGVMFGLVHGNPVQFVFASILGIILAYITVKSGSIIPAIILHFTVNTTATIIELISVNNENLGDIINYAWYGITFVVGLTALIVALKKYKVRLPKQTIPQKKRALPVMVSSPTMWIYTIMYGLMVIVPFLILSFALPFLIYYK